jgi:hypothetical protein
VQQMRNSERQPQSWTAEELRRKVALDSLTVNESKRQGFPVHLQKLCSGEARKVRAAHAPHPVGRRR